MAKNKIDFAKIATQTVGAAAGAAVAEIGMRKVLPNMKPAMKGLVQIGAGAAAIAFGGKYPIVASLGSGAAAAGGLSLAMAMMPDMFAAPVAGIGADDELTIDTDFNISGVDDNAGVYGTDDSNNVI